MASARLFTPLSWNDQRFNELVLEVFLVDGVSRGIILRTGEDDALDLASDGEFDEEELDLASVGEEDRQ